MRTGVAIAGIGVLPLGGRGVFGAARTIRDRYVSVWNVFMDGLEGKVEIGIDIVDLVNMIRGLEIAHVMQVCASN